jgi:glycyl-tRNA synthetase
VSYHLIDGTIALPEAALKASGHVDHFTDLLVRCGTCKETHRADHLLEEATGEGHEGLAPAEADAKLKALHVRCPKCKGELGPAQQFNMMFPIAIGPLGQDRGYLRPETAQVAFLNFKREFEALRRKLPMGLAVIGRCFRNEISPRQGAYRMREFLQAELQIFFDPATWDAELPFEEVSSTKLHVAFADEKSKGGFVTPTAADLVAGGLPRFYVYHLVKVQEYYLRALAMPSERFRFAELGEKERAFYNKVHFDIEVKQDSLGGFKEVGGVHYRTDHDLGGHQAASKEKLEVSVGGRKVLPHVLELSFGVDRNVWALLDLGYTVAGEKATLRLPPRVAPIPVAVFPLVSKDGLPERARSIWTTLRRSIRASYDSGGSIGRRYARMDEVGTPFCVTVDHETMTAGTVTVRDRDSTAQKRVAEADLPGILAGLLDGSLVFAAL